MDKKIIIAPIFADPAGESDADVRGTVVPTCGIGSPEARGCGAQIDCRIRVVRFQANFGARTRRDCYTPVADARCQKIGQWLASGIIAQSHCMTEGELVPFPMKVMSFGEHSRFYPWIRIDPGGVSTPLLRRTADVELQRTFNEFLVPILLDITQGPLFRVACTTSATTVHPSSA